MGPRDHSGAPPLGRIRARRSLDPVHRRLHRRRASSRRRDGASRACTDRPLCPVAPVAPRWPRSSTAPRPAPGRCARTSGFAQAAARSPPRCCCADFFQQNLSRIVDDVVSPIQGALELWPTPRRDLLLPQHPRSSRASRSRTWASERASEARYAATHRGDAAHASGDRARCTHAHASARSHGPAIDWPRLKKTEPS
jgi:hypothetical protein